MIGEQRFWGCDNPVTSLRGHTINVDEQDLVARAGHTSAADHELVWKLNAEQERLMRLLPDPPVGYHWDFETHRTDDWPAYVIHFRMVAVLKENN